MLMNDIVEKLKSFFSYGLLNNIYKTITFHDFFIATFPFCLKMRAARSERKRKRFVASLKNKQKITVAFFLQSPSVWKYDSLYWLFERSERFEPVVVVCPFNVHLSYDRCETLNVLKQSEDFVKKAGYRYLQRLIVNITNG